MCQLIVTVQKLVNWLEGTVGRYFCHSFVKAVVGTARMGILQMETIQVNETNYRPDVKYLQVLAQKREYIFRTLSMTFVILPLYFLAEPFYTCMKSVDTKRYSFLFLVQMGSADLLFDHFPPKITQLLQIRQWPLNP